MSEVVVFYLHAINFDDRFTGKIDLDPSFFVTLTYWNVRKAP